ncbi:unnamed protein product [Linum trigynum]|uniref:Uncharacterized protein n=1 Tax=Linum trigynum TaxID=586398 RepID=A0AAV2CI15_9ROSI
MGTTGRGVELPSRIGRGVRRKPCCRVDGSLTKRERTKQPWMDKTTTSGIEGVQRATRSRSSSTNQVKLLSPDKDLKKEGEIDGEQPVEPPTRRRREG